VEPEVEVHLPLVGLIDFAAEKARVEKELGRIAAELQGIEKRLSNKGFVERAPAEVVEKDRARAEELQAKREKLARHLARISSSEEGMDEKNPQGPQGSQPPSSPGSTPNFADRARERVDAARPARGPMAEKVAQAMTEAGEVIKDRAAEAGEAMSQKAAEVKAAVERRRATARKPAKKAPRKAAAKRKAAPKKAA